MRQQGRLHGPDPDIHPMRPSFLQAGFLLPTEHARIGVGIDHAEPGGVVHPRRIHGDHRPLLLVETEHGRVVHVRENIPVEKQESLVQETDPGVQDGGFLQFLKQANEPPASTASGGIRPAHQMRVMRGDNVEIVALEPAEASSSNAPGFGLWRLNSLILDANVGDPDTGSEDYESEQEDDGESQEDEDPESDEE